MESLDFFCEKKLDLSYQRRRKKKYNYSILHRIISKIEKEDPNTLEMVKKLLSYGADFNVKTIRNCLTPFHLVCKQKSFPLEIISYLLENKSDPNITRYSNAYLNLEPLDFLYYREEISCFLFLKERKYDLFLNKRTMYLKNFSDQNIQFFLEQKLSLDDPYFYNFFSSS